MDPGIRTSELVRLFRFCRDVRTQNYQQNKTETYTGAFKAKVGLEALMGVKTVGQIAREYQVHPVQVTQWKGVIRDRLPELFKRRAGQARTAGVVAQLHEKSAN